MVDCGIFYNHCQLESNRYFETFLITCCTLQWQCLMLNLGTVLICKELLHLVQHVTAFTMSTFAATVWYWLTSKIRRHVLCNFCSTHSHSYTYKIITKLLKEDGRDTLDFNCDRLFSLTTPVDKHSCKAYITVLTILGRVD